MPRSVLASFFLLLAFGTAVHAQEISSDTVSVSSGEIIIRDTETPNAASFGIDPKIGNSEAFGWQGSDPAALKAVVEQFQQPLASPTARQAAVLALSAPVLPDATENVPANWLLLRLKALVRIGEYEAAWRLYSALPHDYLTEPLAEVGADIAWLTGRTGNACELTASLIKDSTTQFPTEDSKLYWLTHYTLCQRLINKSAEADLTLHLLQETATEKLSPALSAIVDGWDQHRKLPPLTAKDAAFLPALSSLLNNSTTSGGMAARIPAGIVTAAMVKDLPPPLQAALSRIKTLPPALRAHMAENALHYHLLSGAELAQHYAELATAKGTGYAETRARAALYNAAIAASTPAEQETQLTAAMENYHRFFSSADSRAILAIPLRQLFEASGGTLALPLSMQAFALYLDRGEQENAWAAAQKFSSAGGGAVDAYALEADAATRMLRLLKDPVAEAAMPITLPSFAAEQAPPVIWLASRYGKAMEAMGTQVNRTKTDFEFDAPPPSVDYPSPEKIEAMQASVARIQNGEAMLRSVLMLGSLASERTSDAVLAQVIAFWHDQGLDNLAASLASEATTGVPDSHAP